MEIKKKIYILEIILKKLNYYVKKYIFLKKMGDLMQVLVFIECIERKHIDKKILYLIIYKIVFDTNKRFKFN